MFNFADVDNHPPVTSFLDEGTPKVAQATVIRVNDLNHRIRKREVNSPVSNHVLEARDVNLQGLGRTMHLVLSHTHDVLSPQFKIFVEDGNGQRKRFTGFNAREFYTGQVKNSPSSKVSAHIDSETGLMTAAILTDDREVYFVEPHSHSNSSALPDEMLFYKLNNNLLSTSNNKRPFCDSISLNETAGIAFGDDAINLSTEDKEGNDINHTKRRDKREEPGIPTRCPLHLVADYRFFRNHGSDVKQTTNYLVSLIDRINKMYLETEWADVAAGEESLTGYGFVVQEILVHSAPTQEEGHYNSEKYSWQIRDLLESFSRNKHHKWYCLVHLFTHQRFESGVLGLAFVAHVRKFIPGGVCTSPVMKDGEPYYYNTGVSTTMNSLGNSIFTRITDLITAHELGHSWGAEHDPDIAECSPRSSSGGAYLMHTYSLAGYETNNKVFSPCSKRAIANVLKSKTRGCFVSHRKSFCGNGIVDPGEECDAGLIGGQDTDPCCTIECRLKSHAKCSDFNHLCCQNCQVQRQGFLCREANHLDCKESQVCNGISANCPIDSPPIEDGRECMDSGRCRSGRCIPFCETRQLLSCMCESKTDTCLRCCRQPTPNSTCERFNPPRPIILKDGTPCAYGYCDKGFCRRSTQDTISRLWGVIEERSVSRVIRFILDNMVIFVPLVLSLCWFPIAWYIKIQDDKEKAKHPKRHLSRISRCTNGSNCHGYNTRSRASRNGNPPTDAGDTHELRTFLHDELDNERPSLPSSPPPQYDELDHEPIVRGQTPRRSPPPHETSID